MPIAGSSQASATDERIAPRRISSASNTAKSQALRTTSRIIEMTVPTAPRL